MKYILLIIFLIIILFGIIIILKFRKKKISQEKREFFMKNFKKFFQEKNKSNQIIHLDKLYHKILIERGYNGTFGEILKSNPDEIGDINKIWELHKIRNKLVHDFNEYDKKFLDIKSKEYRREIVKLLGRV